MKSPPRSAGEMYEMYRARDTKLDREVWFEELRRLVPTD